MSKTIKGKPSPGTDSFYKPRDLLIGDIASSLFGVDTQSRKTLRDRENTKTRRMGKKISKIEYWTED